MKLINLKLKNFRPFINSELVFSTDPNKNITLIKGDNGNGKSTLIKAIVWCLYQVNLFVDNQGNEELLINSLVKKNQLKVGVDTSIEVQIRLEHKSKIYDIRTFQTWLLDSNRIPKLNKETETVLNVTDNEGKNKTYYQDGIYSAKNEIEKILRSDLIPYFFVDGENSRIENLTSKKKLKEAITTIMGLETEEKMAQFLKADHNSDSIVGRLKNRITDNNSGQINSLNIQIQELVKKNELDEEKIEILDAEINKLNDIKSDKEKILDQLKEISAKQAQKKSLIDSVNRLEISLNNDEATIEDYMSKSFFFQDTLITQILSGHNLMETLTKASNKFNKEKSLSHISSEAIDQLVEKGVCVCGTKLKNNQEALRHLEEIKDYIAPRNFGKGLQDIIRQFSYISNYNEIANKTFNQTILNILAKIIEIDQTIELITAIEKEISGYQDAGQIQTIVQRTNQDIAYKINQIENIRESVKRRNFEILEKENEIRRISPKTKENELNDLRLEYVETLYRTASDRISDKTKEIMALLNKESNEIFSKMYFEEQRTIRINQDYTIVTASKDGNLIGGSNTGAMAVANFAFISALITSAKQFVSNMNSEYDDNDESIYPLLMDAPFSPLGSTLMKGVAKNIHKFCDQMVLFVKPNDYEQVKEELKPKIGKSYILTFNNNNIQDCLIKENVNV
jgi:DNA sulfur modification protein DndD